MKIENQRINVVGYVISTDWDAEGNITQIAIETDDFDTFLIVKDEIGLKLFDYVNKEIGLEGIITGEGSNGYQTVKVSSYKLVEAEDDDFDFETDDNEEIDEENDIFDEDDDNY